MDGPNVNLKMLRPLNSRRDSLSSAHPIDIVICSLHVVCGALKSADEALYFGTLGYF